MYFSGTGFNYGVRKLRQTPICSAGVLVNILTGYIRNISEKFSVRIRILKVRGCLELPKSSDYTDYGTSEDSDIC